MSPQITHKDVLTYLRTAEAYGSIPAKQFKASLELFTELMRTLEEAATDQALSNLALHLDYKQRAWLQRLAQAANRIDEAGMAAAISEEAYHAQKAPRFGAHNPEQMDMPFWKLMVRLA